jgi:hypothetical protein
MCEPLYTKDKRPTPEKIAQIQVANGVTENIVLVHLNALVAYHDRLISYARAKAQGTGPETPEETWWADAIAEEEKDASTRAKWLQATETGVWTELENTWRHKIGLVEPKDDSYN